MTGDHDHDHDPPQDGQRSGDHDEWSALDVDAAFAAIVAQLSAGDPPVGPWPAAEDLDGTSDGSSSSGPAPGRSAGSGSAGGDDPRGAAGPQPLSPAPPGTGSQQPPALPAGPLSGLPSMPTPPDGAMEDDEGYVPPEPPPMPRGDLLSRVAWAAVIGGPLFLLISALAWRDLPTWLLLSALGAFIGGFITLVARMPGERPDDPDDGAVV